MLNRQRLIACSLVAVMLMTGPGRHAYLHARQPVSSPSEAPRPAHTQTYSIHSSSVSPKFTRAVIEPQDVHPGDNQTMEVRVQDAAAITSVSAAVETDNGIRMYPLALTDGTPRDGTWKGSWKVRDTHSATYRTTFKAVNKIGDSSSLTLTWTDPCSPPAGGDWTLDGNCSISGVHGVDNGSLILNNAAYTLTILGGATFAWNSGRNITLTAGSTAINNTGQFKQTNLWMTDADADGYPDSTTQFAQDTVPANGRRRYLMNSYTTVDLYPASPTTWQNLDCYRDADGDGYAAGGFNPDSGSNLTTGLVSYWKLDETTGSTAADSKGTNTGTLITSLATWTQRNVDMAANSQAINSLIYNSASGKYVAAGSMTGAGADVNDAVVWESTDLTTWTRRPVDTGTNEQIINAIIYANGKYVAAGPSDSWNAIVWESTDLITWTKRTVDGAAGTQWVNDTIFANGKYIVAGTDDRLGGLYDDAVVWESSDLITWTERTVEAGGNYQVIRSIIFANGKYVAAGEDTNVGNVVWESTDLITWTKRTISAANEQWRSHDIIFANSKYIVTGTQRRAGTTETDALVWESADLITWTERTVDNAAGTQNAYAILNAGGQYLVGGGDAAGNAIVWESADLITWTKRNVTTGTASQRAATLIYDSVNGKYLAGGYNTAAGNSNDAVVWESALPSWVAGKRGNALNFDGVDDYVNINDSDVFTFGNGATDSPFSVAAWVKVDTINPANENMIVAKYRAATGSREWFLSLDPTITNGFKFQIFDESAAAAQARVVGSLPTLGVWIFVAATYDGRGGSNAVDGITLYVNGAAVAGTAYPVATYVAMENKTHPVQIGAFNDGTTALFDGSIDEVGIWSKALTATEIADLYNAGNANTYLSTSVTAPTASGASCPAGYSATSAGTDCLDSGAGAANVFQNVAGIVTDADQDGYTTGTAATTCVGASTVVSGRTYYRHTNGAYSYIASSLGADCNDADNLRWRNRYLDADADDYAPNSTLTCVGDHANYYDSRTGYNDCNDASAATYQNLTCYADADNDAYTVGGAIGVCKGTACNNPVGHQATQSATSDCDAADGTRWRNGYIDGDGDTYGAGAATCVGNHAGYVFNNNDCNDACASCYPGSTSSTWGADGLDQDCDGTIDDTFAPPKSCPASGRVKNINEISGIKLACKNYCGGVLGSVGCCNTGGGSWSGPADYNFSTCTASGSEGFDNACDWSCGLSCTCPYY